VPKCKLDGINLYGDTGRSIKVSEYSVYQELIAHGVLTFPQGHYQNPTALAKQFTDSVNDITWTLVSGTRQLSMGIYDTTAGAASNLVISLDLGAGGPFQIELYTGSSGTGGQPRIIVFEKYPGYMPCHALHALGFTDLLSSRFEITTVSEGGYYFGRIDGETPFTAYHPLHQNCNGARLYVDRDYGALWDDQGDDWSQTQATVKVDKAKVDPRQDKDGVYLARYTSKAFYYVLNGSVRRYLSLTTDPLVVFSPSAYVGSQGDDDIPTVMNVWCPIYKQSNGETRGPFEALLFPLLSTGTQGYNGTYDRCPLEISWAFQASLVDDDSFRRADMEIANEPTAQRWNPVYGCYFRDDAFSMTELLEVECQLYGYMLCWQGEQYTLVNVVEPDTSKVTTTIDDSNSTNISDAPAVSLDPSTVVNRFELKIKYDPHEGKYKAPIIVTDADSKTGQGNLTKVMKIEHPGLPVLPDGQYVSLMMGRFYRRPSQVLTRTINNTLENKVFVGRCVRFTSSHVPNPAGDGSTSVDTYAMVLNKTWNYRTSQGTAKLMLLSQYAYSSASAGQLPPTFGSAWAPAALVDITAANGGWDSTNAQLTLEKKAWTLESFTSDDGSSFSAGDYVFICETDPDDPTDPLCWEGPGVDSYSSTHGYLNLLSGTTLTGWDYTREHFVTFANHNYAMISSGQTATRGTWWANYTTERLGTATPYTSAFRWG